MIDYYKMKKELLIKVVIEDGKIGSIIQKIGFKDDVSSKLEIIGILNKLLMNEQQKMDNNMSLLQEYNIKDKISSDKL